MGRTGSKLKSKELLLGIFFVILLFSNTSVYGQWSVVDPSTLPTISSDWGLESIHFTSSNRGWAIGNDFFNQEGVLLFYSDGEWMHISSPSVSTNWDLRSVHFPSLTEGWAVGTDFVNKRGVLLRHTSGAWTSVPPPGVSTDWELSGAHFTSSTEGWAIGRDVFASTGVLLRYLNGVWWPLYPLPPVSTDWELFGIHFTSSTQGWAVGGDFINNTGVLLSFANGAWTSITPPDLPDASWLLSSVHFTSSTEGWAVGEDLANNRGVILHYRNGVWTAVLPPDLPDVSADWALSSVHFVSPTDGWAVGQDFANHTGVLLHYDGTKWTSVIPPDAGTDWGLFGLHMIASNDGWAVGQDVDGLNGRGVLLRYSVPDISVIPVNVNFGNPTIGSYREKIVNITNNGNGNLVLGTITDPALPFTKRLDNCSGKTLAPLQKCTLIYRFQPTSEGTFTSNSNIPSNDPDENPVTVALSGTGVAGPPLFIDLLEPADGTNFTACSSFNRPLFRWDPSEAFRPLKIQFSSQDFTEVSKVVRGRYGVNELQIGARPWNALLRLPGSTGGTVYWKVVGTRTDRTKVESRIFSFIIDGPLPVGNPQIVDTTKSTLPTISWENNCAKRFTVWFGDNPDFTLRTTRKRYVSFVDTDPTDNGGTFAVTLTPRQWSAVRNVVSNTSGSTIYWYVNSRDHLRRRSKTGVMNFILTD